MVLGAGLLGDLETSKGRRQLGREARVNLHQPYGIMYEYVCKVKKGDFGNLPSRIEVNGFLL